MHHLVREEEEKLYLFARKRMLVEANSYDPVTAVLDVVQETFR